METRLSLSPRGMANAISAITGADSDLAVLPPPSPLLALVAGTVVVVAALAVVPASLGGPQSVTEARSIHAVDATSLGTQRPGRRSLSGMNPPLPYPSGYPRR